MSIVNCLLTQTAPRPRNRRWIVNPNPCHSPHLDGRIPSGHLPTEVVNLPHHVALKHLPSHYQIVLRTFRIPPLWRIPHGTVTAILQAHIKLSHMNRRIRVPCKDYDTDTSSHSNISEQSPCIRWTKKARPQSCDMKQGDAQLSCHLPEVYGATNGY